MELGTTLNEGENIYDVMKNLKAGELIFLSHDLQIDSNTGEVKKRPNILQRFLNWLQGLGDIQ